jgi:hypothetical protein
VAIAVSYGPDSDWLKNLTAAGGGRMRRNAKSFGITDPRVVSKAEAAPYVDGGFRETAVRAGGTAHQDRLKGVTLTGI